MVTTFERLAKVLKGYIKPANWIERAFAELASAIGSVLPSVSDSDRGKFLGVNSSNNNLSWKAIRQVPEVEGADKGKYLHANSETGALEWSEAGGGGAANALVFTVANSTVIGYPSDDEFLAFKTAVENGEAGYVLVGNEDSYRIFDYFLDSYTISGTHLFFTSGVIKQASITYDDRRMSYVYDESVIYTPNSQ